MLIVTWKRTLARWMLHEGKQYDCYNHKLDKQHNALQIVGIQ